MKIITDRPTIVTSIPQYLEDNGIPAARFADAVASHGAGRNAAYTLVRGETGVSAIAMLVAAFVLEESVDALFHLEYPTDELDL